MEQETREPHFHVAELPLLYAIHHVEEPATEGNTVLAANTEFPMNVMTDVSGGAGKAALRAKNCRRIEPQVSPPLITVQHRPHAHRHAFHAVVRARGCERESVEIVPTTALEPPPPRHINAVLHLRNQLIAVLAVPQ